MNSMDTELRDALETYQGDLLAYVEQQAKPDHAARLVNQLQKLDLPLLHALFQETQSSQTSLHTDRLSPMPFQLAADHPQRYLWIEAGETALSQNQVAAFLVAGGQGSRLGYEGPKGCFQIGLPSQKSLFQLQAERLLRLQQRYQCTIPWCIMTSPINHEATEHFFVAHDYFGLSPAQVRLFPQNMIPALDTQGRILLESPDSLALVPDGNGGCFRALRTSGALDWLAQQGVEYLFINSVDNALVKICDPFFVGALACSPNMLSASKVVSKRDAQEKVGIFAYQEGKPTVIEYSDLPDSMRNQTTSDGSLVFDGGNIAIHLFRMQALRQLQNQPLPWHQAFKKVPFWTPEGFQHPQEPNAWKFEQFLFDAFPLLDHMLPFGVERESEFAPVKNATGQDSPLSALLQMGTLHRQWLKRSQGMVDPDLYYEISPLISYAGEGLNPSMISREMNQGIRSFTHDPLD